ncbi:hypothetical protein B0H10DRAFT_725391 [Mycena sp. CBHHK59/15]|nr:hypothetical protein B0H10DRAFT_725391 [Mycena sp. CBHHK59/15]
MERHLRFLALSMCLELGSSAVEDSSPFEPQLRQRYPIIDNKKRSTLSAMTITKFLADQVRHIQDTSQVKAHKSKRLDSNCTIKTSNRRRSRYRRVYGSNSATTDG